MFLNINFYKLSEIMTKMAESDFVKRQKGEFIADLENSGELENCVANEGGKLNVMWENLVRLLENEESRRYDRILTYLRHKGVLTIPKSGSIYLQCDGADLSPRNRTYFHFTNSADAKKFLEAKYGGAMFKERIEIRELSEREVRFYH